ncbi:metal-dependent hydrolase [Escherichia coli]|uniref:metal-dependent hydrolase n=1 Tax=Escherichia coli TaxID=562 RepID=UPI000FDCBFD2|nr:metal-dependent hydrolase [Escherichia coli]RVS91461.1 metal-dependent hydrolase [Escherichia coli]
MTAEGHLLFSIACAVFAKNAELTPVLAQGDWWHIVPSAILTCLLPDIDHPKSFLGQRLKWISKPIARAFGHRGFTHSLLAVFALLAPAGVPLLWPCRWRFRLPILVPQKGNQLERFICMALFVWSVWMPHSLPENSAVRWSSQMINTLQIQFHRLIKHQVEY